MLLIVTISFSAVIAITSKAEKFIKIYLEAFSRVKRNLNFLFFVFTFPQIRHNTISVNISVNAFVHHRFVFCHMSLTIGDLSIGTCVVCWLINVVGAATIRHSTFDFSFLFTPLLLAKTSMRASIMFLIFYQAALFGWHVVDAMVSPRHLHFHDF